MPYLVHYTQEGKVAEIANDMHIGRDTIQEEFSTCSEILHKSNDNGVHLSARKRALQPIISSYQHAIYLLNLLLYGP